MFSVILFFEHFSIIWDMLTRIRNANIVRLPYVKLLWTDLAYNIAKVLADEGFIYLYSGIQSDINKSLNPYFLVGLKYKSLKEKKYISNIVRVSRPGQRVYCRYNKVPRVMGGVGIAVCNR